MDDNSETHSAAVVLLKWPWIPAVGPACRHHKHSVSLPLLWEPNGVEQVIGVGMSRFVMKRWAPCVSAMFLLALSVAAYAQRPQNRVPGSQAASEKSNVPPGGIKGRVLAVDSGQGMGKVMLSLIPAERRDDGRPLTVRTTPEGNYEYKQVAPGRYRLFASRNGNARQGYGQ